MGCIYTRASEGDLKAQAEIAEMSDWQNHCMCPDCTGE